MAFDSVRILAALGGAENIVEFGACGTRLRTVVGNPDLVDAKELRAAGAYGVLMAGPVVQVVVGLAAINLETDIDKMLDDAAGG